MDETQTRVRSFPGFSLAILVAAGASLFGVGLGFSGDERTSTSLTLIALLVLLVAFLVSLALALGTARFLQRVVWPGLSKSMLAHTRALDALPVSRLGLWILVASAAGLFVELMLIRWQATNSTVFSHYKNISLLAAFLGLGSGYALGGRRPVLTPLVMPALALQFIALHVMRTTEIHQLLRNPVSEVLSMGLLPLNTAGHAALVYGFLLLSFVGTALTCLPLGHLAAYLMRRSPSPLVAYGWNLAGSLLGVALLVVLSQAWSPPAVWLTAALVLLAPFLLPRRANPSPRHLLAALLCFAVTLGVILAPAGAVSIELHSPYQPVRVKFPAGDPPTLETSSFFQHIVDLKSEHGRALVAPHTRHYYDFAYLFSPSPKRALVVGAGTGNDVAAALRNGAGHVTAVEIDPAILFLGKSLHPEQPYQDPRVEAVNQDARAYLRGSDEPYDLIVYGLLDSHASLSGMSTVRLDSFVYTLEAFREARERLSPGGVIAMSFALLSPRQAMKFFLMLTEAWDGQEPRVFRSDYIGFIFLAGPGAQQGAGPAEVPLVEFTSSFSRETLDADLSTDDWPFIYMPTRAFPTTYLLMLGVLGVASFLFLRPLVGAGLRESFSPTCFLLGAGFMLIETKGITELALNFGSTWYVVSAVIVGVLVMAFLANLWVHWRGAPAPALTYGLLICSLVLGAALTGVSNPLAATALVTLPIFFSGFAFSSEIKALGDASAALSSNLYGAMLGGLLEYNAMQFGYRSLYVLAIAIYALAYAAHRWRRRSG